MKQKLSVRKEIAILCKWLTAFFISLHIGDLKADIHKIQIMMTVPRTISTAFERSIMARGDYKVFHEPWNSEYIYRTGKTNKAPPLEIIEAGGYKGIKAMFCRYAEHTPVYVKDMIWSVQEEIVNDQSLLADPNVIITLLIRDPPLSMESFFLKIGENLSLDLALELTRLVFRYDALVLLAEKHREIRGHWPILIEAEELCVRPHEVMKSFCQQADIPFLPEALTWKKKMPDEWKHLERWHVDAAESEGFFIPNRASKIRFSAVPDKYVPLLEAIYQTQKPFYEKLKTMKKSV